MGNTIVRVAGCGPANDDDEVQTDAELSSSKDDVEDEAAKKRRQGKAELLSRIVEYKQARLGKFHQQMALQELVNDFNVEINKLSEAIKELSQVYRHVFKEDPPAGEEPAAAAGDGDKPRDEAYNESTA